MNVKLLRKIQKHILAEPRRFAQGQWLTRGLSGESAPPCGTQACIAGWACVLSGKDGLRTFEVPATAAKLLGLTQQESDRLFAYPDTTGTWWPLKFSKQYFAAKTKRGKVGAGVRRIDHFIKTKGAE